jgi:4-hydroxymandelate oxidase
MLLSSAGAVAAVALTGKPADAQVATAIAAQQAKPDVLAAVADFEVAAKERMTRLAYEYVTGGAGDERTLAWNSDAYDDIKLRSRVLVDVSRIDTSTQIFGQQLDHPILLAPTAYHKLVHPEGEVATARGAGIATAPMIVSSFATTKIEDIARAASSPLWFQLYVQPDRGFTRESDSSCPMACPARTSPT